MYKKAIVTGCNGYIGRILCRMLKEQDYYVIGVDIKAPGGFSGDRLKRNCDLIHVMDYCSDEFIKLIGYNKEATVFHLAASSLLGPSYTNPEEYFFNNTVKSFKFIEFLNRNGFRRLIFASTAAVYSEMQEKKGSFFWPSTLEQMSRPVTEDDIIKPPNNYGLSKLMTEQMLDSITAAQKVRSADNPKENRLQVFSFRFFNVIGGYEDDGHGYDTPHIMSQLIESRRLDRPFTINGSDYKTKDGTCIRDYVHVMDVCRAMIHADVFGKSLNCGHYKYNLGTGIGHSNKEIVDAFNKVVSPHLDAPALYVRYGARRPGDPPYLVADPSKYINESGFKYKYSADINSMIESAWKVHKNVRRK